MTTYTDIQVQVRRDTAANWTSNNPTLPAGQIGFETDTRLSKVGDGATAWTSLSYVAVTESQISDLQAYLTDLSAEALSTLSDVTITAIASGELLKWNGSAWINNTLAEAGIATAAQGALADSAQQPPSEGAFANGDKTKLDGIEASADVTDAANVETAIEAITFTPVSGATGDEVMIVDATDGGLKAVLWENLPGGTGDAWGDVVDADIVPDADGMRDLGTTIARFAELHVDSIDLNGVTLDGITLADPGADRLLFWDDSAGTTAYLTAGAGLTITTTTIAADAVEGTAILSTSEAGGTKFLREDGDGTCSWQAIGAGGTVDTSGTPVLNDFARFTDANTIEGRSYAEVRTDLGLVIGTDVQAFDANLPTWPVGVDATEVGHLNGVTSAIQTQLDAKAPIADPTFTGEIGIGAVNVSETELGILEGATLDTTELNYVDGVTSAIQTQLDAKAPTANPVFSGTLTGTYTIGGTPTFPAAVVQLTSTQTLTNKTLTNPKASYTGNNAGTKSTGTYTPVYTDGNMQYAVNGGAHTLAPQSGDGSIVIQYTNNASAGAITTSGFTVVKGDSLTTTNGDDFMLTSVVLNGFSVLTVQAMQ